MAKAVGIDLGTTRSLIADIDNLGRPFIIPNSEGERLTPSVVLFDKKEDKVIVKVGGIAKRAAVARPEDVVRLVKRYMCIENWSFVDTEGKEWRPETVSALILKKLKQDSEKYLKEEITHAVITVPYYFGNLERERTKQAGELAGFNVMRIVDEPVAAAIAYGLDKQREPMICLVYDLGGGTFDIAVMEVNAKGEIEVLATHGDRFLGGADFDEDVVNYFADEFNKAHGVDPLRELKTYQDFLDKAEKAKEDLSFVDEVDVGLSSEGKVLDLKLTREKLESLIAPDIEKTKGYLEETLIALRTKREKLSTKEKENLELIRKTGQKEWEQIKKEEWARIDKILLVGGSTRIPLVQNTIKMESGKDPEIGGFNPDELVALGAASIAAWRFVELFPDKKDKITVRTPEGLPVPETMVKTIVSHSLGVEAIEPNSQRKINSRIISKGEKRPATGIQKYTTVEDYQTAVNIVLLQGEDEDPKFCRVIGNKDGYVLRGIPAMAKGLPDIEIKMEYDLEDIVHVKAKELISGAALEFQAQVDWLDETALQKEKEKIRGIEIK
jgi:molecular chaperone DnaK